MADLDSILSGKGAAASEPETVTEETPAVVEQAQAEQVTEQPEAEGQEQGQKMVPHEALHAEKQKVKRYTEQVAEFEKKMTEREAAWEKRFEQLLGAVKPQQPAVEEPKALEPWDEGYSDFIRKPIEQQISQQREQVSQLLAVEKHGHEVVGAAWDALLKHPNNKAIAAELMQSVHPWGSVVEWHKGEQERAELANPEAYKAKIRAEIEAEIRAEIQGGNQQQQTQQPAQVMPSNLADARNVGSRSGPAWSGPASLNDIFDRAHKPNRAA